MIYSGEDYSENIIVQNNLLQGANNMIDLDEDQSQNPQMGNFPDSSWCDDPQAIIETCCQCCCPCGAPTSTPLPPPGMVIPSGEYYQFSQVDDLSSQMHQQ